MADSNPTALLRRTGPDVADIVRPGLSVRTETGLGIAKLRIFGRAADARFQEIAGIAPPLPCREIGSGDLAFAWLAPGEWLITGAEAAVAAWVERATALGADDLLAIDFSHARTAFLLEGESARAALAAHCPLDLWPDAFPAGAAARSLLGDTGLFIARLADTGDAPRFRIIVDQTMAAYAGRLFARA
ncbi:sarcosine oxidase subunit gamma [Sphingopyxis panaciterrae]|uniref:sarcosine oxidase subunit gamma n=1 Tax=Sphingopyxis panaciterrae TaxID=363841 RepID=UPI00141E9C41|nr:sarcosine oxidase subunit gamma family protein [Sphingopyxis panaciterrae]NIJ35638.1 sarcosine oxidase subunit gamma [Sphingopyxis panaciterrae]